MIALEELIERAHVVAVPTRTRFRGVTVREAVIFEGAARWSEFSPFTEYADAESAAWLQAAVEFGWGELPSLHAKKIAVNATVPALAAADVPGLLERFEGCETVKVKVAEKGQSLGDDVARVAAVRKLVGADARVRIDANAGWSLNEARQALAELQEFNLDYAEQPVADIAGLAALRVEFAGAVKIAADESVRKADDPLLVARAGAADLLIVKAQPLGGINRALEIIRKAGLPVVVSSALDTSVGISMGAHLAAALAPGELYGACGLGTVALLSGDVTSSPLLPESGFIPVDDVAADPELLQRFAASHERRRWWINRVSRCHALLR